MSEQQHTYEIAFMPALPQSETAQVAIDSMPAVLADIYQEELNLSVWRAGLSAQARLDAQALSQLPSSSLQLAFSGSADDLVQQLAQQLLQNLPFLQAGSGLLQRSQQCIRMFADLFEPKTIGLRLELLDRAMCPRFHIDRLAVRMITTFCGPATQWLRNEDVDRTWLGPAGAGQSDETNGVIRPKARIQQLQAGDVALMKGEGWEGNEGRGLVHRSPHVPGAEKRLVLTLDWLT